MSRDGDRGVPSTLTRRAVVGAAGTAALAGSAGCVQRAGSLVNRSSGDRLSLKIKTVPADQDEPSLTIAHHLAEHLDAAGIDARVVPMARHELLLDVLVNHDFDLYVMSHHGLADPDGLRTLLHSQFAAESGWQNPFGVADLTMDDYLERQREREGQRRRESVTRAVDELVRKQPFVTVARPDDVRAVREGRYESWNRFGFASPLTYLSVSLADDAEPAGDERTLTLACTDGSVTRNLNPLAVEFRSRGTVTGLLYDPLVRPVGDGVRPWLATEVVWSETDDATVATATLRDGLSWHDGTELTPDDVAFTYRFLQDTSLGKGDVPMPAPRFRGPASLVTGCQPVDRDRVRLRFDASPEVARRALTVPVLPAHVWEPKSAEAAIAGVEVAEGTTEALVWNNADPVGSGPLRVDRRVPGELLSLVRVEDHFTARAEGLVGSLHPPYRRLDVRVTPSSASAVKLVAAERADATMTRIAPKDVPRVGRTDNLRQVAERSPQFYHVGFNARTAPLSNPRFRRTVARLLDKEHLARTALNSYGTPLATPLGATTMPTGGVEWRGADPEVPFLGDDGELDVAAARTAFRDAGYRYDDDDRLLVG
jgi:peptide/nickel transport system substrate-binding protein